MDLKIIINGINSLTNQIMQDFFISRTADDYIKKGVNIFTEDRKKQYKLCSEVKYLQLDEKSALNLKNCVTTRSPNTKESGFRTSIMLEDGLVKDMSIRVHNLYQRQKNLNYANCELQAIFFDYLVYKSYNFNHYNIKSAICNLFQPAHSCNIVYIELNNKRLWYLYDSWAGIKGKYLGSYDKIGRSDFDIIQKNGGDFNSIKRLYISKGEQDKILQIVSLFLEIMLYFGHLFDATSEAKIKELADRSGIGYESYLMSSLGWTSFVDNIPIGLNGAEFYYHYNIYQVREAWKTKFIIEIQAYINKRKTNTKEYSNIFNTGYSRTRKLEAAHTLIQLLEGRAVDKIHEYKNEFNNGDLGDIFSKIIKYITKTNNNLQILEWICFNPKNDPALTPMIDN